MPPLRRHALARVRRQAPLLAGALALTLPAAVPAAAHAGARPVIGIGDQKPTMFGDPRFAWLGIREVRLVVSWDVRRNRWDRGWVDGWLRAARASGARPFVSFGRSWLPQHKRELPSARRFRREFRAFHRRYPWVRTFAPWNEANHCSQPTCRNPRRAAAYYNVIRVACPRCTVLGADVLDQPNMGPWIREFLRYARGRPRVWGLHNYIDANRRTSVGTRRLLRLVDGEIWFTETGGIVRRAGMRKRIAFPESAAHAARATRWIFRLARLSPRIRRLYLYHWNADSALNRWDSGLIGFDGRARPAFDILARYLGRDPARAPRPGASPPPREEPPPPPPQEGGGSGGSPPPSGSPPPPCALPPLC